ncbi:MAG: response regulator [Betaproteobacteria bacterium]|nr:response regulator [Betaproteobacteria bacterium]
MSHARALIVVIEDDPKIRRLLRTGLTAHGFDVSEAATGSAGLVQASTRKPDLILLDLGLPDMDGSEVIRRLRDWWTARPLIVLSGRDTEFAKVSALESGADDYVTKPFSMPELLARVRVALRHGARNLKSNGKTVFGAFGIKVDLMRREVTRDGVRVHLTPTEYRMLAVLVRHAGMLVTADRLLTEVWGPKSVENTHYLRTYVAALRKKLEADPVRPQLLKTEAGVGYRLETEETEDV